MAKLKVKNEIPLNAPLDQNPWIIYAPPSKQYTKSTLKVSNQERSFRDTLTLTHDHFEPQVKIPENYFISNSDYIYSGLKTEPMIIKDDLSGFLIPKTSAVKFIKNLKEQIVGYTMCSEYLATGCNDIFDFFIATEEELIRNGYIENLNTGIFYKKASDGYKELGDYNRYENVVEPLLKYCTKKTKLKYGADSITYTMTEGKQYTFGCELEYSSLWVPQHLILKYNMGCVRDGSLNKHVPGNVGGPELVTGILKGDAGFKHLQKICTEFAKRGKVDHQCGVHVHIGGFEATNDFVLFSYMLGCRLQEEIFTMMPKSRRGNEYCKYLPSREFSFNRKDSALSYKLKKDHYYTDIFKYLLGKKSYNPKLLNSSCQHPLGSKAGWDHSTPRYCWLNLFPTAFNTRSNGVYTLEFRPMSGSSSFFKIHNWIKICMAFVYYVENNQKDIIFKDKITLLDIIQAAYPKTYKKLYEYILARQHKFNAKDNKENDEYNEELENEKSIKDLICV